MNELPNVLKEEILVRSNAWRMHGNTVLSGASVCREWRDVLFESPFSTARAMIAFHGSYAAALNAAAGNGYEAVVRLLLERPESDLLDVVGAALEEAAKNGHDAIVRLLLGCLEHTSSAIVAEEVESAVNWATMYQHESVLQMLLTCPLARPPSGDSFDGLPLCWASDEGNESIARLLLDHGAYPDAQGGWPLQSAVSGGQESMVRLLLESGANASINCDALIYAVLDGHESIVRLLLDWPVNPARANCQNGQALVSAAEHGHEGIVRMLLEWPTHAPRADCQDGLALTLARANGHLSTLHLLEQMLKA